MKSNQDSEEGGPPYFDSMSWRARAYISENFTLFVISGLVAMIALFAIVSNEKYNSSLGSALTNGFGAFFTFGGMAFLAGLLINKSMALVGHWVAPGETRRGYRRTDNLPAAAPWESSETLVPTLAPKDRGPENRSLHNLATPSQSRWKTSTTSTGGRWESVDTSGPIFVVHGHARAILHELVRVLERGTGREVIVLHEQSNSGKTVLEKFEEYATASAYAVVLLTGDDEGRALSASKAQVRGRQNVIFELGFFFGKLGRERVTVLVDPHVEKPSDVDGLVYIRIDEAGAWKQALARELQSANIQINYSRIP